MKRIVLALPLLLGACLLGRSGGPGSDQELPSPKETRACLADLTRLGVRYRVLPDRDAGKGCRIVGAVQLLDIGVPVGGLGAMRCGLARHFTEWVRDDLSPRAMATFGTGLARVDTLGSYSCRGVIGSAGESRQLSGHAVANAVDVAGVTLADGRRVTVARDWRSTDPAAAGFLHAARDAACRRFGTVLSPEYNAAHHDHLHLEDRRAGFCR